jgi:taurine dioxygenase
MASLPGVTTVLSSRRDGTRIECSDGSVVVVTPVGGSFGARITGIDLRRQLNPEQQDIILHAFHVYHLLCFPGQDLAPADELRLLELFNPAVPMVDGAGPCLPGYPQILIVSNIAENGRPLGLTNKVSMEWHTDSSEVPYPPVASLLYAVEVPQSGGETYFANGHLAYETLDPVTRASLDDRRCRYSWVQLQEWLAAADGSLPVMTDEVRALHPDLTRPVVRVHPVSGRKALWFTIESVVSIDDMSREDSRVLLEDLIDHIVKTPHVVYRHDWEVGDAVVWDDRCVLHSVCEYNYAGERRLMHLSIGRGPDRDV